MTELNTERKPLVALVGRPNVGKSTLFNRLSKRWNSIVEDQPGITRDRLMNDCELFGQVVMLMDTGGLNFAPESDIERKMSHQAMKGVEEADLIVFLMDGRHGVHPTDHQWIKKIRKLGKPTLFVVNKLDNEKVTNKALADFLELGLDPLHMISAEKKRGLVELAQAIVEGLELDYDREECSRLLKNPHKRDRVIQSAKNKKAALEKNPEDPEEFDESVLKRNLKISIIGRPNVGKSTMLNAILGQERSLVHDEPGTTRDPIQMTINWEGQEYDIIDTAGIRRRAKTKTRVEKFSVMSSLNSIDQSDLVLLVLDGEIGPTEQDAHVAGYAFEKQKGLIIVVNKWDLGSEKWTREFFEGRMELKMNFLNYCPVLYVSAKTRKNLDKVFKVINTVQEELDFRVKTSHLNKAFEEIVDKHPLPTYKGKDIKMFYATQIGVRPPTFIVFCSDPAHIHFTYRRYLLNALRNYFDLPDIPVRIIFKKRGG